MKVVLLALALVFAVEAREGICKEDGALTADLEGMLSVVKSTISPYLSACSGLTEALMKRSNGCVKLMEQGYCYYSIAKARTSSIDGVTFDQIQEGFPDVMRLAGYGCENKCFENIAPIVKACYADEAVKEVILGHISNGFDKLRSMAVTNQGSILGTPLGKVLTMTLEKYSSFDDVRSMVLRNKDKISDAYFALKAELKGWCAAGCPKKTKKWGVALLPGIAQGDCNDPKVFCGACEDNTRAALPLTDPRMPCCMVRLWTYFSERAANAKSLAADAGSDIGVALAEILESGDAQNEKVNYAIAQYNCVKSTFDDYIGTRSCA